MRILSRNRYIIHINNNSTVQFVPTSILDTLNYWQCLMICSGILPVRIVIKDTRPDYCSTSLGLHSNAKVFKVSSTSLLDIIHVKENYAVYPIVRSQRTKRSHSYDTPNQNTIFESRRTYLLKCVPLGTVQDGKGYNRDGSERRRMENAKIMIREMENIIL